MTSADASAPLRQEDFDPFVEGLDYPVFVVTAAAEGETAGCLVGFATQCSIDPPRLLVCLSEQNHTFRVAGSATHLAVHLVPSGQEDLAELFGGETDDETDKLAEVAWRPGPGGVPVLEDCPRVVVGEILERRAFGDHTGYLLAPVEVATDGSATLTFADVVDLDAGHDA